MSESPKRRWWYGRKKPPRWQLTDRSAKRRAARRPKPKRPPR